MAERRFALERHERILAELRRTGSVRISELAELLDVAVLTIRRDIDALAQRGLLSRVHGGATLRSPLDARAAPRAGVEPPRFRVGMIVPSLSYYWPPIVLGARTAAHENSVQLVLRGSSYTVDDQRRQIAALVESGGLHGLIVAPRTDTPDAHALLTWLDSIRLPVVLIERRVPVSLPLTSLEWVASDHGFGAALAAGHLAGLGHSRVGVMTFEESPTAAPLREGWFRAVRELGLVPTVDRESQIESLPLDERRVFLDALLDECGATGTTALLVHADPQAALLQQHLADRGVAVPGQLSIVAYDDEIAASADPPITALRPPKHELGRAAVEAIAARLSGEPGRAVRRTFLLPELHVRASSGRHAPTVE